MTQVMALTLHSEKSKKYDFRQETKEHTFLSQTIFRT